MHSEVQVNYFAGINKTLNGVIEVPAFLQALSLRGKGRVWAAGMSSMDPLEDEVLIWKNIKLNVYHTDWQRMTQVLQRCTAYYKYLQEGKVNSASEF